MIKRAEFLILFALVVIILFTISCASTIKINPETSDNIWSLETGPISGGHFYSADVGDFNGDQIPDIAAGSFEPGGIMVWLGKGDGSWIEILPPVEEGEIRCIAVADLNNDKLSDILVSSKGGLQGINLWLSKGDGNWGENVNLDSDPEYQGVKLTDVNSDGWIDIIAANESTGLNGGVRVWINSEGKDWIPSLGPERAGTFKNVEVADINKDGHIDLIASSIGPSGGIKIWYGDGKGNWSPSLDLDLRGYALGIAAEDLDQDGWTDIVATFYYEGIFIFYNEKNGLFSKPKQIAKESSFWDTLLMDWDNDGRKDILASSMESEGILVWSNCGNRTWKSINIGLPRNQTYYGIKSADFNLDNLADLFVASYSEGIHVWLRTFKGQVLALQKEELQFRAPREPIKRKEEFHLVAENKTFTTIMGFSEYRIAVEDKLRVIIWVGTEKNEYDVVVKANGEIFIPLLRLGNIKVAGLSPFQLKEQIEEKLRHFLKQPLVDIEIMEYIGRKVTLTGEIRTLMRGDTGPGIYALTGKTNAMEFLSEHGGATARGNLSQVRLIREGRAYVFNLFKAISQGDQKENPILDQNDMLYIPSLLESDKRLLILGEVKNPGIITYIGDIALLEAISKAGSFTKDAVLDKVFIVRGDINKPDVLESNLKAVVRGGDLRENIPLQSGDIVFVPRRFLAKARDFLDVFRPTLLSLQSIYILHKIATGE